MDLSKIKDLTEDQKKAIMKEHDLELSGLKKNRDELLEDVKKAKKLQGEQGEQSKKEKEKAEADKIANASSVAELRDIIKDQTEKNKQQDQRILDAEKKRVDVENTRIVGVFADKFISDNVVNDSLVRDAIKAKITNRLGVRDGNVVELNGSELTGKTGDQVLSEIRADKGYSNHLVANSAKGGGANGSTNGDGGAITEKVSREEFEQMPHSERPQFFKNGGTIVE